jgi:hypothetical protein
MIGKRCARAVCTGPADLAIFASTSFSGRNTWINHRKAVVLRVATSDPISQWSSKRQLAEQSFEPGASVALIARQNDQAQTHAKFGRKSEKLDRQLERLEARLEDLVAEEGVTR